MIDDEEKWLMPSRRR